MEKKKINFEEKLARLDVIVKTMETKILSLDESISLFDEGNAIIKDLEQALTEAESKVAAIVEADKGQKEAI